MIIILLSAIVSLISSKEIKELNKSGTSEETAGGGLLSGGSLLPIKRHSLAHRDVNLDCQRANAPVEISQDDFTFSWIFYPGREETASGGAGGYPLCGGTDQPSCSSRLLLRDVNRTSTGLYKCSIVRSEGLGFTLTSTPLVLYHLVVRDDDPKFIEGPKNIIVYEGSDASLDCKVLSESPMAIKWFKRDDRRVENVTLIRYNNHTYRPVLNVESEKDGNVYRSELLFRKIFGSDSGIYACTFLGPTGQIWYREGSILVQPVKVALNRLLTERWDVFFVVLVGLVLVLVTLTCCLVLCIKQRGLDSTGSGGGEDTPRLGMRRKPTALQQQDAGGYETSEYEHVIL